MPPTRVHLNGSVNLPDVETVMREVLARIPSGLSRVPDGEPGERGGWIGYQFARFRQMDALTIERSGEKTAAYTRPKLALRPGAGDVVWPDLGYAGAAGLDWRLHRRP